MHLRLRVQAGEGTIMLCVLSSLLCSALLFSVPLRRNLDCCGLAPLPLSAPFWANWVFLHLFTDPFHCLRGSPSVVSLISPPRPSVASATVAVVVNVTLMVPNMKLYLPSTN